MRFPHRHRPPAPPCARDGPGKRSSTRCSADMRSNTDSCSKLTSLTRSERSWRVNTSQLRTSRSSRSLAAFLKRSYSSRRRTRSSRLSPSSSSSSSSTSSGGQQHLGLDVQQGGGHDEVFAGNVQVEALHQLQRGQVLLGDGGDGYVDDVELVLLDQVEQQVQRAFVDLELDVNRHDYSVNADRTSLMVAAACSPATRLPSVMTSRISSGRLS